jgi:hypothetical protein
MSCLRACTYVHFRRVGPSCQPSVERLCHRGKFLSRRTRLYSLPFLFICPFSPQIKDDRLAGIQSPIIEHIMNNPLRRETGRTSQTAYSDPSAKIWDLYLSEAKRIDKDHSESWTANTDGVLVFVRQTSLIRSSSIILTTQAWSDWSFLCGGDWVHRPRP